MPRSFLTCRPEKQNIGAVVVTFNPAKDIVRGIESVLEHCDYVVIVDNTPGDRPAAVLAALRDQVTIVHRGCNQGVAKGLNDGIHEVEAKGYDWVLTLDQDTVLFQNFLSEHQAIYDGFPEKGSIGVLGSRYQSEHPQADEKRWEVVRTAITSGSLIPMQVMKEVGPFRDELFIDCVDLEFCLRAANLGYKIVLSTKRLMDHPIGVETIHQFLARPVATSNHSPARRYFMVRNTIQVAFKYWWRYPGFTIYLVTSRLKSAVLIMFFESNRLAKLKYMCLGFLDGIFGRFDRNPLVQVGHSDS